MEDRKLLFTPGPLTTSASVKESMLKDYGSRDSEFINIVKSVRSDLLKLAGLDSEDGYEAILMQGAGTFGLEAVASCALSSDACMLIIINGAYGRRMRQIATTHNIKTVELIYDECELPTADDVSRILEEHKDITHVSIVHCETTTGIFNDIESIGSTVKKYGKSYIVDAMSSFGAVPLDFKVSGIDYLISSSNKCIEGVPGFSFIIAKREELEKTKGQSRTLSLDIYEQWKGLEANGQFRFTPPVHSIAAFKQAINELFEEGGVAGRAQRYKENNKILVEGMRKLGFEEYLDRDKRGYIITSFLYSDDDNFDFSEFYERLNGRGFVIYPGKLSQADCFRIGNIGKIFPKDVENLIKNIAEVLEEMAVKTVAMNELWS